MSTPLKLRRVFGESSLDEAPRQDTSAPYHALLWATNPVYQAARSTQERCTIAHNFRRALASNWSKAPAESYRLQLMWGVHFDEFATRLRDYGVTPELPEIGYASAMLRVNVAVIDLRSCRFLVQHLLPSFRRSVILCVDDAKWYVLRVQGDMLLQYVPSCMRDGY